MGRFQQIALASVLVAASPIANATDWYWCDTTHAYYPAVSNCSVTWRKVTIPPTANPAPVQQPSIQPPSPPRPAPVSAPVPPDAMADFRQGLADREDLEAWFGQSQGDYHEGALYWSAQRSLPHPGSCANPAMPEAWRQGCAAAQKRLALSDARRHTEPEYKRGWNSWKAAGSANIATSMQDTPAIAGTVLSTAPPVGDLPSVNRLREILTCDSIFKPQEILTDLQRDGIIGMTPLNKDDGVPVFSVLKNISISGVNVKFIEGWDDDGSLFSRGPGTAPPIHISIIVDTDKNIVYSIYPKAKYVLGSGGEAFRSTDRPYMPERYAGAGPGLLEISCTIPWSNPPKKNTAQAASPLSAPFSASPPPPSRWYQYAYPTGQCEASGSPSEQLKALKLMQESAETEDITDPETAEIVQTSVYHSDSKRPGGVWINTYFRTIERCKDFAKKEQDKIDKYK